MGNLGPVLPILFPIAFCISGLLLFAYLIWIRPEPYLRSWMGAWAALSVLVTVAAAHAGGVAAPMLCGLLNLLLLGLLLRGAQLLHRQHPLWLWTAWGLPLGVLALYWRLPGTNFGDLSGAVGLAMAGVTVVFLLWRGRASAGQMVLATAIGFWAIAGLHGVPIDGPWVAGLFAGFCGAGILAVAIEQEREITERNLRDLSTLDLETHHPGSDGPESTQILHALVERLARVLQAPQVLLWSDRTLGRPATESVGFTTGFSHYLDERGPELTAVCARYGGLVVGRNWAAYRGSETASGVAVQELRRRLQDEGTAAFALTLLQSKAQPLGIMLVARRRRRNFLPGELRLLLVLSGHAALALENLHLFRKMLRRTREFQTLTEIGTALSSSLEIESLLRVIYAQLQKLMDVRNFYVAFQDADRDEIVFMLEVEDGRILPKRQRPRIRALTEHVIATGRSLLISEDLNSYAQLHGLVVSGRPSLSWMGVPLMLKGRPEGVIALQSYEQTNAYDRDHLHMIEIVASQAATAIENARLFEAVQRDSRHRDFLAQAARVTISALRTPEVLRTVVEEIAKVFQFDHVAIGIVNGEEIEFRSQTQGDLGRSGLRVVALGNGLAGRAALSSQMMWVPDLALEPHAQPLNPSSRSALAVPINFGKDTLGVLVIESNLPHAFTRDQVQVMQTLADQLAAALNHSRIYEQAEQQAITDSLTHLRTRRFFMQSLDNHLSRALDGSERFCIVLSDLNDFGSVNDTLGHLEGDRVLERVARVYEKLCRMSSILARYGGDEFTILLPGCGLPEGTRLVERLQEALHDDPLLAERRVTASFGLAVYPENGVTAEDLLHAADVNMYASKAPRKASAAETGPITFRRS